MIDRDTDVPSHLSAEIYSLNMSSIDCRANSYLNIVLRLRVETPMGASGSASGWHLLGGTTCLTLGV